MSSRDTIQSPPPDDVGATEQPTGRLPSTTIDHLGSYVAAVDHLTGEVRGLRTDVAVLAQAVEGLQSIVGALQASVGDVLAAATAIPTTRALASHVEALEGRIADVEARCSVCPPSIPSGAAE